MATAGITALSPSINKNNEQIKILNTIILITKGIQPKNKIGEKFMKFYY